MTTLSWAGGSIEASLEIRSLRRTSRGRTIAHEILDGGTEYTPSAAGARTAELSVRCDDAADATLLEAALRDGLIVSLVDAEQPQLLEQVILVEEITVEWQLAGDWTVTAGVAEVTT